MLESSKQLTGSLELILLILPIKAGSSHGGLLQLHERAEAGKIFSQTFSGPDTLYFCIDRQTIGGGKDSVRQNLV